LVSIHRDYEAVRLAIPLKNTTRDTLVYIFAELGKSKVLSFAHLYNSSLYAPEFLKMQENIKFSLATYFAGLGEFLRLSLMQMFKIKK
jgi:hypothetical protein